MSDDGPPYVVTYRVWSETDDGRETETFSGFFNEPSKVECINAIVYEIRGKKSDWELAYVDEIKPAKKTNE